MRSRTRGFSVTGWSTAVVMAAVLAGCAGGPAEDSYPKLPTGMPSRDGLLTKEEQQKAINEMANKKDRHKTDAERQIDKSR